MTTAKAWFLIPLALTGLIFLACLETEERGVTYENASQVTLRITSDMDPLVTLEPGETHTFQTRRSLLPDHLQAYDPNGNLKYDKIVTWDELKANGWRVVIN